MSWPPRRQAGLLNPWVSIVANLASIVSVGMKIIVWINVSEISQACAGARFLGHFAALERESATGCKAS